MFGNKALTPVFVGRLEDLRMQQLELAAWRCSMETAVRVFTKASALWLSYAAQATSPIVLLVHSLSLL